MVSLVWFLPLLFALGLLVPIAVAQFDDDTDLFLTRAAVTFFGQYVAEESDRKREQQQQMRAAHVGDTHRSFASRTWLFSAMAGVSGSILGVYVIAAVLAALEIGSSSLSDSLPPELSFIANFSSISQLTFLQLFVLLFLSSATFGAGLAFSTYYFRWLMLDQRAYNRAGMIEATLPRTVAFIYALSRSGMAFPKVMNTLAENEDVYGEAARELGVAVREMETLGADPLTAMDRLSNRTPADNMSEFAGNLSSVLGSGRNLSEFLRGQYHRFQEEAESQQEQYLEILSTMAEAYVTVLVAGPLFLITILVVIGMVLGSNTMGILRAIVYLGIPLATLGFAVYIDSVSQSSSGDDAITEEFTDPRLTLTAAVESGDADGKTGGREKDTEWRVSGDGESAGDSAGRDDLSPSGAVDGGIADGGVADGGVVDGDLSAESRSETLSAESRSGDRWQTSRERLDAYDAFERWLASLRQPGKLIRERPITTTYVTIPLALVWIVMRAGTLPLSPLAAARTLDSPLAEGTLLVLVVYAVVYEYEKRRTRGIERAVPDFLDRMASVNDAGMSVVESVETMSRDDIGALTPELKRTWLDMQWGADLTTALHRLKHRVDSSMVNRAVALTTNAVAASGDVAPVLEIAADEARSTAQLRKERRQVMMTYMIVIYVSFGVFIAIVGALTVAFIPAIESAELGSSLPSGGGVPGVGGGAGALSGIQEVNPGKYIVLFFHASIIQGSSSGIIAGQLGEGDIRDGVKHMTIMLLISYVAFTIIGA
jgi:flagellar protein FlaJ